MRLIGKMFVIGAAALSLWCSGAPASTIYQGSMTISSSDATQLGRLSRNSLPQDWSGSETFPGLVNTATAYHYTTYTLDLDALMAGLTFGQYLQISIDSTSTNTFLSAYLDAYDPLNKASNFLGDAGTSGNSWGNPLFFQVVAGASHDLVLLLNETVSSGGLNQNAGILVEAFQDTEYTDLANAVPEPASVALVLVALLAAGFARSRQRSL